MKKLLILAVLICTLALSAQSAFALTIDSPTDGATVSEKPMTFTGTGPGDSTIRLKEDGVEIATTNSAGNGDWSITTSDVTAGEHEYTAEAYRSSTYAFMNSSVDGRIDVLDMTTRDFTTSFEIPEPYNVSDLQVEGNFLFVLGTDYDTLTCEVFAYQTDTLERVETGGPMIIAEDCYAVNFDLASGGTSMSVLWTDSVDSSYHVTVYDLEGGVIVDVVDLGFAYGYPRNTLISDVNDALFVHFEDGIEKYVFLSGSFSLDDFSSYPYTATTTAVFGPDDAYLLFGTDDDGKLIQKSPNVMSNNTTFNTDVDANFNVVGVSPDGTKFYASGYNGDDFSLWEIAASDGELLNETTFDQYPESFGVTPNGAAWVVGDNHSYGYIYIGDVNVEGIDTTLQYDNSSYRMSSDDFFSPHQSRLVEASITTINSFDAVDVSFADGTTSKTVGQGGAVDVSGSGFQPGSDITITLNSTPVLLATLQANSSGGFSTTVTIPSNTTLGAHTLVIAGTDANGNPTSSTLGLTVGRLPATGNDPFVNGSMAVGLIAAGFVLTRARRKVTL